MLQDSVVLEPGQEVGTAATPVSSLPASRWSGRIPGLDGVRALSFILVFLSHMGFMGSRPGGFAVSVFFLLSGYLSRLFFKGAPQNRHDIAPSLLHSAHTSDISEHVCHTHYLQPARALACAEKSIQWHRCRLRGLIS